MLRVIGRLLILAFVLGVLLMGLYLVVVGNTQGAQLTLPGLTVRGTVGIVVASAIGLGVLVAFLLLLPGRMRSAWRGQRLSRYAQQLEAELHTVLTHPDEVRAYAQAPLAESQLAGAPLPRTGPIIPPRSASSAARPGSRVLRLAPSSAGPVAVPQDQPKPPAVLPGSLVLGRIAGIQIAIHASWLIVVALLTSSLATSYFPHAAPGRAQSVYWIAGLGATLLLFAAVLLHELGHSLVARARGLPVSSITLFIFGGVSNLEQEPRSAGEEFFVAVIGPVVSLLLGILILALTPLVSHPHLLTRAFLAYLGVTNLLLGVFNLLPGFPMDGGRVLRAALWRITGNLRTATRWVVRVGEGLAFLLIFAGVWLFFAGYILSGIWTGFVGWFVLNASQSANTEVTLDAALRSVTVAQVMTAAPPAVPADTSLQMVVDELIWPHGIGGVLVEEAGQVIGMITPADIRRVPREQWAQTTVRQAMTPAERLLTASPRQQLRAALALLAAHQQDQLLVVQSGDVVGQLTRDAVARLVAARRDLEPPRAQQVDASQTPTAEPDRSSLPISA